MKKQRGERMKRYKSACLQKGIISVLFGLFFIQASLLYSLIWFVLAFLEFRDMKIGPQEKKRPSYADKHDSIDAGNLTLYKRYPGWRRQ